MAHGPWRGRAGPAYSETGVPVASEEPSTGKVDATLPKSIRVQEGQENLVEYLADGTLRSTPKEEEPSSSAPSQRESSYYYPPTTTNEPKSGVPVAASSFP